MWRNSVGIRHPDHSGRPACREWLQDQVREDYDSPRSTRNPRVGPSIHDQMVPRVRHDSSAYRGDPHGYHDRVRPCVTPDPVGCADPRRASARSGLSRGPVHRRGIEHEAIARSRNAAAAGTAEALGNDTTVGGRDDMRAITMGRTHRPRAGAMRLQRSMSATPRAEAGIALRAALNPRHYHSPRP